MFLGFNSYSQEYKFEHLDRKQGLSHSFIYTIEQDANGLLLVGTGEGVGVYDGKQFQMFTTENRLAENFTSSSLSDSRGNIWFGHKKGGASLYKDKTFDIVHSGDGINSIVNDIAEDGQGRIWFATQNKGLYFIDSSEKYEFFLDFFSDYIIETIYFTDDGHLLVGSDQGLELYKYYEDENIISKVQEIAELSSETVVDIIALDSSKVLISLRDGEFYSLAFDNGLYYVNKLAVKNFPESIIVRELFYFQGFLYVSTLYNGLLKVSLENEFKLVKNYNFLSGLNTNSVNTTFIDREGVLWVGTYGAGLASKANNYFSFYFRDKFHPKEYGYFSVNEDFIYTCSEAELFKFRKHDFKLLNSYDSENGLPNDEIGCFIFTQDSMLFVGCKEKGLFVKPKQSSSFRKVSLSSDRLSDNITAIREIDDKIWIGTLNGVFKLDKNNFGLSSYNLYSGLSHNNVGYVFNVSDTVYVGTKSAFLTQFIDNQATDIQLSKNLNLVNINMIDQNAKGELWLSTFDNGVFLLKKDTILQYTVNEGLLSNYCYALVVDTKNRVWVTHNGGLSKLNSFTGRFEQYDDKHGLNVKFSKAAVSSWKNELWFGTDNGIIRYDSKEEFKNDIPPITTINSIVINDSVYEYSANITLDYGEYEVDIRNRGLSLRKAKEVTFSHFLMGYEQDWSPRAFSNAVSFPKLLDGTYTYYVKSYNSDGVQGNVVAFDLIIKPPFWKKPWFFILVSLLLVVLVTVVIKLRERNLIKIQKKLEFELDLRTKEVVSQKEKIEIINKDLTDSINYAKRIQIQLLPEKDDFLSIFPKSFVLYKPKDIVSGDFYWVKEFDDQVILVCADCTGHGVPGGFVSMIGSILIHEAVVFHKQRDPAAILHEIDLNIKTVLHQKDDYDSNKDGMDLGVINLNKKTGLLKFSGAIRPCYIFSDNLLHVIKGDRFSIGGYSLAEKVFNTVEYQLKKGDYVYLFSDGFADQFGGHENKKLKMSGFNKLLNELVKLPMGEQYERYNQELIKWMGDNPQMDDILLVGFEY
ncbi:MAG: two-component regulator propeller domain-containing protein [Parvicellaceae bacterium]